MSTVTRKFKDRRDIEKLMEGDPDAVPGVVITLPPDVITVQDWIRFLWENEKESFKKDGELTPKVAFLFPGGRQCVICIVALNFFRGENAEALLKLRAFGKDRVRHHNAIAYALVSDGWGGPPDMPRHRLPKDFSAAPFQGRPECLILQCYTSDGKSYGEMQPIEHLPGGGILYPRADVAAAYCAPSCAGWFGGGQ